MDFESLCVLEDEKIQRILKESDMDTLVLALKAASPTVKERIEKNMSVRACEELNQRLSSCSSVEIEKVISAQEKLLSFVQ